ncbi:MAG: PAC2 family protein [Dehalococcoidia bacterium]
MKINDYILEEPLPELRNPHVIASLRPWVDAGSVGSLVLDKLERHFDAQDLGKFENPGRYFDFTRYRPVVFYIDGNRETTIPNTYLRYAKSEGDFDYVFLHMLEPHSMAEEYIDTIAEVLKQLGVKRFTRVGGMYDAVPHTRPLLVMGTHDGEPMTGVPGIMKSARRRPYQGPTSIMNLVGDKLSAQDIENMMLMVRLPQYLQLEEDFTGCSHLIKVLSSLYNLPEELSVSRRGRRQYQRVTNEMDQNPGVKALVEKLESEYDARLENIIVEPEESDYTELSPSIEQFLKDLGSEESESN